MINKLHYISQGENTKAHIENIQKACQHGAELVQLRLKNISEKKVLKAAEEARDITSHYQTRLIINDHYKIAKKVSADGVHLGKTDTCPKIARKELKSWQIIGGTANTLEDCKTLIEKQVNYIGLGPFRFTSTKDNLSPILGNEGYQSIIEELKTETPVIAIGGITIEDVTELLTTGIHGIAISGEITKDFTKIKAFHTLLNTGSVMEQRYSFKK
ncbi:thiamine phosphate synthase [Hyunsoonleella pacifica]|uniref:Thiamine-phosphate synthase n=1 Tax=Hyunsoonleella pacifica TaxID=1080224 RepID=A0A4Q9FMV0_9FLAO|nr:thiamine phosphate synthase [Hyunsoonleella pacifica]TBN15762.1 thiamine phosphate synthase [Hyunsoonleella pacifica]GGD22400.1 thiamine-phosphate synthase [Hyunsoonleella pacifica]